MLQKPGDSKKPIVLCKLCQVFYFHMIISLFLFLVIVYNCCKITIGVNEVTVVTNSLFWLEKMRMSFNRSIKTSKRMLKETPTMKIKAQIL